MSSGGGLDELQQQLSAISEQTDAIQSEIESLRTEKGELDEAVSALDRLDEGDIVQVPIGGDAYVRAELQDTEELLVSIGGGYTAERDSEGATETLTRKKKLLDDRIDELQDDVSQLEEERTKIEQQAQQMQQQQLQQLQQQMQGSDTDE